MIKINTIRLLDRDDYITLCAKMTWLNKKWFLSSPGKERGEVLAVDECGRVCTVPVTMEYGVRPAALLTIEGHNLHAMDKVSLLGMEWTVFSVCDDDLWVLCDNLVAVRPFNTLLTPGAKNNKWETSTLKAWLDEWIEYVVMGLDDAIYEPLTTERFIRETRKKELFYTSLWELDEDERLERVEEELKKLLKWQKKS